MLSAPNAKFLDNASWVKKFSEHPCLENKKEKLLDFLASGFIYSRKGVEDNKINKQSLLVGFSKSHDSNIRNSQSRFRIEIHRGLQFSDMHVLLWPVDAAKLARHICPFIGARISNMQEKEK